MAADKPRVLVREKIAESGIDFLRERFDVDVDTTSPIEEIIGRYDGIVIRSATKLTAERGTRCPRRVLKSRGGSPLIQGGSAGTAGGNGSTTPAAAVAGGGAPCSTAWALAGARGSSKANRLATSPKVPSPLGKLPLTPSDHHA